MGNKDDLMDMIQYGADKILKTKGSTVTDDDIDAILANSKNETNELKEQWQDQSKKTFSELNLEFNYQQYDGEDYTQRRKEKNKKMNEERFKFIGTLQAEITDSHSGGIRSTRLMTDFRAKKRINYNDDSYFREKLNASKYVNNGNAIKKNENNLKVPDALPDCRYWQLYEVKRLYEINGKEWEFFNKWKNDSSYDEKQCVALNDDEIRKKSKFLQMDLVILVIAILVVLFVRQSNMEK